MKSKELQEILKKHKKWLKHREGGERAILTHADLTNANLIHADLNYADLTYADLSYADLTYAYLTGADLRKADLTGADLTGAILTGADLTGADLTGAILTGTNLVDTILDKSEEYRLGRILDKAIIGYKKCQKGIIVKLRIPKGAVVFGINGNKFRTNKAKCVDIIGGEKAVSEYDNNFVYEKGKTYIIKDFDLMYNRECANGIHFFKTEDEAKKY